MHFSNDLGPAMIRGLQDSEFLKLLTTYGRDVIDRG
jgi:hypothetical protein